MVVDLRNEIIKIFESIITMYLLERDVSGDMLDAMVIETDGSIKQTKLPFFEAMNNAIMVGQSQIASKEIFGDYNVTAIMRAAKFNYEQFYVAIDKLVVDQMEIFASQDPNDDPRCLANIMLASDVYKNDVHKISNDLFMGLLAATDTSRNSTIISMCHLIKNAKSRQKVLDEIEKHLSEKNYSSVM